MYHYIYGKTANLAFSILNSLTNPRRLPLLYLPRL